MAAALIIGLLGGCAVSGSPGRVGVQAPKVIVEPPTYRWHWWGWPHYDVEHRYIVEHRIVKVRDHHYYPFYDRFQDRPHDRGKHKGWYKHPDHHD